MRKTKYITSDGLAFAENKDMEKLRKYSLKGWHVRDFTFMGYTLEKGESTDYVYSIDYRSLDEDEQEEYYNLFLDAGWSHIASEANIHLFRAQAGTKPIYTDRDTKVEKYEHASESLPKWVVTLGLLTIFSWIGVVMSSGTLKSILFVVAVLFTAIAIPLSLTTMAAYSNKWKEEGRYGLVRLVKILPYALLLTLAIILFAIIGEAKAITVLASGIIGGIALPAIIWLVMSLFHKIAGKEN